MLFFRQVECTKLCKGGQQVCGCGHLPFQSMTVHADVVTSNGHHKPETEDEEKTEKNSAKPGRGSSCFFEWEILPQHRIEGRERVK